MENISELRSQRMVASFLKLQTHSFHNFDGPRRSRIRMFVP